MRDDRKERPFIVRFLACALRGHAWDPYPAHLRDEELMECARCGMRTRPFSGLRI